MLRTRLWMGGLLIALVVGVLLVDWAPWYPFLLALLALIALIGCAELHHLLGVSRGLPAWRGLAAVVLVLLANWPAHVLAAGDPWEIIALALAAVVLGSFLLEMAAFTTPAPEASDVQPGDAVVRVALPVWMAAYLGLLPSFLIQLRWAASGAGPEGQAREVGVGALLLAIFVPKCCDIGAYFTGRLVGRHKMTPVLSPKKTWEGLAGGLVLSAMAALAINRLLPVLRGGDAAAIGFGLTVGLAGALGDLAESLIKRDCHQKDASQAVPGFGGVLDVIDAVLFAAPVAYVWIRWQG
jgi:phosphatidate cytidylyltransferase